MIEIDINSVDIILELLIILLVLYLAFFKSYFQEKGKNLATKEDIKEITKTVETVKHELQYNTQTKLSLKAEERNSLIDFAEKYHYWLDRVLTARYSDINRENRELLLTIQQQLEEARFQYDLSAGRLDLYVDDDELKVLHHELNLKTIDLQNSGMLIVNDLAQLFIKLDFNMEVTPRTQELTDEFTALLNEKLEIHKKYKQNLIDKYTEILPLHSNMKKKVYSLLKELLDDE